MQTEHRPQLNPATIQQAFNTATAAVGGLYLATHSIAVTLIGTGAGGLLAVIVKRPPRQRDQVLNRAAYFPVLMRQQHRR